MDTTAAISTVVTVIETLIKLEPEFVQTWENMKPFASALYNSLTGQTISDADLTDLEAKVDDLYNQLQTPLDPE